MTDRSLGSKGEAVAAKYYRQRGYLLLNHNYRTRLGELDLVLYKDNILVFAEVKTRAGRMLAAPAEAVTAQKQQRLLAAAAQYLLLYRPVKAFMDKRTAYYEDMDAEAKQKLADAQSEEKQYRDHLANVENEADALKKQAMESARQAAAEQLQQAKEERRAILDRAQKEAAQEKARVLAEAGTEIDVLVAEAVDKLLPPSGKAPLDDFLDKVEKED